MSSPFENFKKNVVTDNRACLGQSEGFGLRAFFHAGFIALFYYRCSRLFYEWGFPLVSKLITSLGRVITSCDLHYKSNIDGGVMLPHARSVVVGEGVTIETKSSVFQNTTLGALEGKEGYPLIKEGVNIYPGTVVAGSVIVGEYSRVGPNVYLTVTIPEKTRVMPPKPQFKHNSD